MNRKIHTIKQTEQDNPSFRVVGKKEREATLTEITMSDIAKKLRSVYAQMQKKHSPRPLISQSFVEEGLKSYLDDISRAILAEHYIRRQRERKLFEYLEQIKSLVQNLQNEKTNLEEAVIKQRMSHSKSLDSVVQKLADMTCGENQERPLLQEVPNVSRQSCTTKSQTDLENFSQKEHKSSLPRDVMQPSSKEAAKRVVDSKIEEKCSDVQVSDYCTENNLSLSLDAESKGTISLFRFPVKNFFWYFLIMISTIVITLCFYGVLREDLFNFMI
ncbi:hypothetical protein [Bartonella harrusi]|uniref:Uncharacterized protein n=1 Tax=Bartonella harrusi TaxID=2961895 RepID=A0ABY5ER93_9HYPH|nr:hypothetical protein NMK50_05945 [Bartonella harrusi]